MKLVEIRIIFPVPYDRYDDATTYVIAKRAREESDGKGEGIEVVTNEPYEQGEERGMYSHKIYHYRSRCPRWLRWAVPVSCTEFNEKCWFAYPHGKFEYFIPGFGTRFNLQLETFSSPYSRDVPFPDNPAHLTPHELSIRTVQYMDVIASHPRPDRPDWDLAGFECPEAGISKLPAPTRPFDPKRPPEWTETYPGRMMVCVKVIRAHLQIWGLQTRLERYVASEVMPGVFLGSARAVVGWSREWAGMTREAIDRFSDEIDAEVNQTIANAPPPPPDEPPPRPGEVPPE
jgi:hypothetical protein